MGRGGACTKRHFLLSTRSLSPQPVSFPTATAPFRPGPHPSLRPRPQSAPHPMSQGGAARKHAPPPRAAAAALSRGARPPARRSPLPPPPRRAPRPEAAPLPPRLRALRRASSVEVLGPADAGSETEEGAPGSPEGGEVRQSRHSSRPGPARGAGESRERLAARAGESGSTQGPRGWGRAPHSRSAPAVRTASRSLAPD